VREIVLSNKVAKERKKKKKAKITNQIANHICADGIGEKYYCFALEKLKKKKRKNKQTAKSFRP